MKAFAALSTLLLLSGCARTDETADLKARVVVIEKQNAQLRGALAEADDSIYALREELIDQGSRIRAVRDENSREISSIEDAQNVLATKISDQSDEIDYLKKIARLTSDDLASRPKAADFTVLVFRVEDLEKKAATEWVRVPPSRLK